MAKTKPTRPLPTPRHDVGYEPGALVGYESIRPSKINPRTAFDEAALAELAESIATHGLEQPILVRETARDEHEIIAGERRWRAIGILRADGRWPDRQLVPVTIRAGVSDAEALELAIVENLQRVDINPMDEARALDSLRQLDPETYTVAYIAAMIGKTDRYVQQRLALVTKATPELRKAVEAGRINVTFARELAPLPPKLQSEFLDKIADREIVDTSDLEHELRRERIDVKRAIFDLDKHGDRIVEPKKGQRFFLGQADFMALQRAAARTKAKELGTEWAWASFEESWGNGLERSWEYAKKRSTDKTKAGAVVHMNKMDGEVTVEVGLVRPEAGRTGGARAKDEPQVDEIADAAAALTAEIRAKLPSDLSLFHRLVLFEAISGDLGGGYEGIHVSGFNGYLQPHLFAADGSCARWRSAFGSLLVEGEDGLEYAESATEGDVWAALEAMPNGDVDQLLIAWQANRFNVDGCSVDTVVSPALVAVCAQLEVALPAPIQRLVGKPKKKGERRSRADTPPRDGEPVVQGATIAARMGITVDELLDPSKRGKTDKVPTGDDVSDDELARVPANLRREAAE